MSSCREFRALIELYLDNEADSIQTRTLSSHMEECESCRARFEEVKRLHHTIRSAPTVRLPDGFRSTLLNRIQSEEGGRRRYMSFVPAMQWVGAAAVILVAFAIALWYIHEPGPALAAPEIHIVSPREDAVVEQQYVDISVAFSSGGLGNVRVILDSRDVTEATEINEDFLIHTSDTLQNGYHMAIVQVVDNKGMTITERSWAFYVIGSEPI